LGFERDSFIHIKKCFYYKRIDENGKSGKPSFGRAEYIQSGLSPKEDFYEKETKTSLV